MNTSASLHCTRFWPAPIQHLLISNCAARSAGGTWDFYLVPAAPQLTFLRDHMVSGRLLLPGAALLELGVAAGRTLAGSGVHSWLTIAATDAVISAPVTLANVGWHPALACRAQLSGGILNVVTAATGREQQAVTHFTARLVMVETTVPLKSRSLPSPPPQTLLAGIASFANAAPAGLAAGARGIADLTFDAKLHGDGFVVHPAVTDSCMHIAASLNMPGDDGTPASLRVPSSAEAYCALEEVRTGGACASAALEGESLEHITLTLTWRHSQRCRRTG